MRVLIKKGRIIEPSLQLDLVGDLYLVNGTVGGVESNIEAPADQVIDAQGLWVLPGLVDIHVHLREPGEEWKEDIETGTLAAIHGGVLRIACMPNTKPPNDNSEVTSYILKMAKEKGGVPIYPIACITKAQAGRELTEFGLLKAAGAVALSDDGKWVQDSEVMRQALLYAKTFDLPVISHPEDHTLSRQGLVNLGKISAKLGLKGIPAEAETIAVVRDLLLTRETKGQLHLAHLSVKGNLPFLRWAREENLPYTAETCPHYFLLTERECENYHTLAKVNPPLRTDEDVEAIKLALKEGLIQVIASDHAPHSPLEKDVEFEFASFGMIGLELLLSLSASLVREGLLTPLKLAELLITNPAKVIKIDPPSFKTGAKAEVVLFDPNEEYLLDENQIYSKSKNTPFLGRTIRGKVKKVILATSVFEF